MQNLMVIKEIFNVIKKTKAVKIKKVSYKNLGECVEEEERRMLQDVKKTT